VDLDLTGRTCVVTGASSGIGRAVAEGLAAEGARVLLVARDEARLRAAAPDGAGVLALDVTAPDAGERVLAAARELAGGDGGEPWALVSNAGTSRRRPLDQLTDEDFQAQWELNVMASLRLMRALAPAMAAAGGGRIVNVTSSSAKRPSASMVAYSVAKSAQQALSRAFADAYAARGVTVNAVAPGPVATPLWTEPGGLADQAAALAGTTREQALAAQGERIPRGRMAEPEEIAAVIVLLCSPRAANVVGAAWSVDGGSVPVII
jgi:NAD(P)-dependent dehydrogenase (short-subunit alcohol dehydrogenase family)